MFVPEVRCRRRQSLRDQRSKDQSLAPPPLSHVSDICCVKQIRCRAKSCCGRRNVRQHRTITFVQAIPTLFPTRAVAYPRGSASARSYVKEKAKVHLYCARTIAAHPASLTLCVTDRAGVQPRPQPNACG